MKCHFHLLLLFSQLLKQSGRIIADMESQYVVHCISEITAVTCNAENLILIILKSILEQL